MTLSDDYLRTQEQRQNLALYYDLVKAELSQPNRNEYDTYTQTLRRELEIARVEIDKRGLRR